VSIAASVFVVLKLGLRINLIIYLIVAGIACLLINYARADNLWLTITLAMIGKWLSRKLSPSESFFQKKYSFFAVKIAVGASNAIIPTYTAYHYPGESDCFSKYRLLYFSLSLSPCSLHEKFRNWRWQPKCGLCSRARSISLSPGE
jgi:hypothetical protein